MHAAAPTGLRRLPPALRMIGKTIDRSTRFAAAALAVRGDGRRYTPLVYAMIAGLLLLLAETLNEAGWATTSVAVVLLLGPLMAICAIDARFGIIPDGLVVAIACGGCLEMAMTGVDPVQRTIAAAMMLAGAWLFRASYFRVRGFHGLGLGDVKLTAAGVLWTGLGPVPAIILIAVVSALACVILQRLQGNRVTGRDAIAFGPHLALGIWLTWVAGALGCCSELWPA
ncbi:MAG: A24 family peptidase [Xanthobacteraceae bacterium]|nr:A24 family peptidase [Xanthobacteraceae bacterium]